MSDGLNGHPGDTVRLVPERVIWLIVPIGDGLVTEYKLCTSEAEYQTEVERYLQEYSDPEGDGVYGFRIAGTAVEMFDEGPSFEDGP